MSTAMIRFVAKDWAMRYAQDFYATDPGIVEIYFFLKDLRLIKSGWPA